MRRRERDSNESGLSFFLIAYSLTLFSLLLGIHLLQPDRDAAGSGSPSPGHQQAARR